MINAPAIGGSGDVDIIAVGGTLAISISASNIVDNPHGSLAVTVAIQVCPGSNLSVVMLQAPSKSGTEKPFRDQEISNETGSPSRSVAVA